MKVSFLIPPVLDGTGDVDRCFGCNYSIYFLPLLPALYAATVLRPAVDAVAIHDFAAQRKSAADFEAFIAADDSDIYCFYSVFLSQSTDTRARSLIRARRPNALFVYCGPQATFAPEVFLDAPDTYVVRGEPDLLVRALIEAIKAGDRYPSLSGVSFLKDGRRFDAPAAALLSDIDALPIPDRTLLDHRPYNNPKLRSLPHTAALTSRGCFGRCWYCVPNSLSYAQELEYKRHFGRKPPPRVHSAPRVIEEVRQIAAQGLRSVSFIDDQFLWDEERTLQICAGIKDLGLEWSCLCRPERITGAVARAMKEAGCSYVDIGTESFVPEILDAIKKDVAPEATTEAVRILKKNGIEVELNILLGATPAETEGTIRRTLKTVRSLDVDYVLFSIANPFPGTDFYAAAKKEGWLFYGEYVPRDPARDAIISYPHLSKERLERLCAGAYASYYLRPRYLYKQLRSLQSARDFLSKVSAAARFFFKLIFKKR